MDRWTDRLSEYLDDDLAPDQRAGLEEHLAGCEDCREVLSDLRTVAARAGSLRPRVPASDLWPGIERRLGALRRPERRTVAFSVPQLAAAAVLLVALSGGLVWYLRAPAGVAPAPAGSQPVPGRVPDTALPVSLADQQYGRALADLQRVLETDRGRLDPDTVAVVEKNLAVIDAAIEEAQRALERDPSNAYLNGHLADARRRKLALLRSVSAMADPEG